jgi:CRISPR-associated protein Csd2
MNGSKSGQYSSARVHRTLQVNLGGSFELNILDGLDPEVIDGF